MSKKKVLYYLNQFFGQIGGEDQAHIPPQIKEEAVGPGTAIVGQIADAAELVATFICGDNYFNENRDAVVKELEAAYEKYQPDLVIAGPAFNAGRYGVACAGVAKFFNEKGVPVVSGMYEENPGLEEARAAAYVVSTGDSAGTMRKAIPPMVKLCQKLLKGETPKPLEDDYFAQGKRLTILVEKDGSERAMEMLLKRLKGEEFTTELPMPVFDVVEPAAAIADLSKATIALVTSGGIVPQGNPDHIQSASAQMWGKYDVSELKELKGTYCTIHGGYDPVYANEWADRVAPLDELKKLEAAGKIGSVYKYFYTTTGTGTSVANSEKFGREIGAELKEAGVDGVILTST